MDNQACPLCRNQANFEGHGFQRKHFICDQCGEFIVTRLAEAKLATFPLEWCLKCATMGKDADEDSILFIFIPDVVKEPGLGYESLRAEVVPRSQFQL